MSISSVYTFAVLMFLINGCLICLYLFLYKNKSIFSNAQQSSINWLISMLSYLILNSFLSFFSLDIKQKYFYKWRFKTKTCAVSPEIWYFCNCKQQQGIYLALLFHSSLQMSQGHIALAGNYLQDQNKNL